MKTDAFRAPPRFFVALKLTVGAELELPERAARHCAVLRLRPGDAVTLFTGEGGEYSAELTRISRNRTSARIVSRESIERESPVAITLAQCVSSGDRMDLTLQKCTELGVACFIPLESKRSVVRLSSERADRRVAHWRNVVVAACEQCGRNRVPEVRGISDLESFLAVPAGQAARLLLAPDAAGNLRRLPPAAEATLLAGPEGGLTPEERRRAEQAGFLAVRFGPRVLRTETAPVAAVAALQALWGDC